MRPLPLVLAVVLLVGACTSDTDSPAEEERAEEAITCDPVVHDALTAWEGAGFSGSVAMTTDGEPTCLAGFGLADETTGRANDAETVFAIGSVSKAMTAAAVLGLVDDGLLALDDRAGDLVPGLAGPAADAEVQELLLHTSGLAGSHGTDHEPLDHDAAVAAISGLDVVTEPGTTFGYSNAGYTLLALIVEEVSGTDYRDHLVDKVLRDGDGAPLGGFWDGEPAAAGARATGYLEDGEQGATGDFAGPHWAVAGNGDVAMTMPELAAWTRALMTGELLSPESTALLTDLQVDAGDGAMATPGWGVLEPSVLGEPALASAGGGGDVGHDVVVAWLPTSGRVVAIGSNRPEITAEDLLQTIGPALVTGDTLPVPAPEQEVDPAELAALEGRYRLGAGDEIEVQADGQHLRVTPNGPDALAAIFPLPDGVDRSEAETHEADVLAALRGETEVGREEVELLEDDLGPITSVDLIGTIIAEREFRTYVEITADGSTTLAWYALDERGDIAAVDLGGDPPSLTFGPIGSGRFRPTDPTVSTVDVALRFEDGIMAITGPTGSVEATRS
jgi:CubicO group peptidase (beta-lactamase class C family)